MLQLTAANPWAEATRLRPAPASAQMEPAHRIGKVAEKRKHRVAQERIDSEMESFGWLMPAGDFLESRLKLRPIAHLNHDVELAETPRPEPQLAPCNI